jgi:uncharacterized membrane protein YqjE
MSGRESSTPGLFHSVRALGASLVALAHTRLELLGTELQEEVARLVLALLYSFAAVAFAALGIAFAAVAILIAAWDSHRLAAAVVIALVFLALGGLGAWVVRRLVFARLRVFDASLSELDKDYARLKEGLRGRSEDDTGAEKTG